MELETAPTETRPNSWIGDLQIYFFCPEREILTGSRSFLEDSKETLRLVSELEEIWNFLACSRLLSPSLSLIGRELRNLIDLEFEWRKLLQ